MSANAHLVRIENNLQAKKFLEAIGSDQTGKRLMLSKSIFRAVQLHEVDSRGCNIIKQEMLAQGGEAAVKRGVINYSEKFSDVLLLGTEKQYKRLILKLKMQPFGLKAVAKELEKLLSFYHSPRERLLRCRDKEIILGRKTAVMGILNVTPDSFSDGGKFQEIDSALAHAFEMAEAGADIIDIGAESTRPGSKQVPAEEELSRLLPVLKKLCGELPVPISVDTYKSEVARRALDLGAEIINDIWGFKADPQMPVMLADYPDVPVIIMHNQYGTEYRDLMGDILFSLRQSIERALAAGIAPERIVIDPGIGFGKDVPQNLEVMNRLDEFKSLGYPILLGTSRKSLIGRTLDLPADQRLEGTAATVALGIVRGVDIVRVHDVLPIKRICKMMDAMVR